MLASVIKQGLMEEVKLLIIEAALIYVLYLPQIKLLFRKS